MALDPTSNGGYQKLYQEGIANRYWDPNASGFMSDVLGRYGNQFAGSFKNMTGRDPTADEMSSFYSNIGQSIYSSPQGYSGTSYNDVQNLINPFIQNQFGQQVQQNQQSQQQTQLQGAQQQIQDLIGKQTAATASNISDPNSSTYRAFSGNMNNLGISPSSGAFQAGLGSTLGSAAATNMSAALGDVSLPAITGQMQTAQAPYQASLQNMYPGLASYGSNYNNLYDFNLQSDLAQRLTSQAQPSSFEKDLGYANTASNIVGNLGSVAGPASTATSYVCMELIRRGLAWNSDLDLLHYHILPAMFYKGRAFWHYAVNGKRLVDAVNAKGINWRDYRKRLLDDVIACADPVEATNTYALACRDLALASDPTLWDERVMRVSFWDSLKFLPRLFAYKPFREAMAKTIRMRMLLVLDLPLSRLNDGTR